MTGGARGAVDSSVVRRTAPRPQTPPDICLPNIQTARGSLGCRTSQETSHMAASDLDTRI